MSFQIGGVPEEFSADITVEFSLRLMAEHVLVQAPAPPSLKLFPTNLGMLKMENKKEHGTCLTSEKGCEVFHLLVNFVI